MIDSVTICEIGTGKKEIAGYDADSVDSFVFFLLKNYRLSGNTSTLSIVMESEAIKSLLQQEFTGASLDVTVEGSHVALEIISDVFEGLNTLKRQQKVYGVLSDHIASGAIHAVNMKTLTTVEAAGC